MDCEQVKKFLRQAGMEQEEIKGMVNQSVLGLRRRKHHKEQVREVQVQHITPIVQSNYKTIGYFKPEYKPETFRTELANFRKGKIKDKEAIQWQKQNIKLLESLYEKVVNEGGIIELLSKGAWDRITKQMRQLKAQLISTTDQQILEIYLENLIEFELMSVGTPLNIKKGVDLKNTLRNGSFLHEDNKAFLGCIEIQADLFDQQVVVIENAVKNLGLESIDLARINQECGHESVELRIQNPLDYGFNPYKLTNKDDKMTIKEYCQYQKHFQDQKYCKQKFGDKLKGGKVFFAVNFQPSGGTLLQDIQQKLKNTLFGWTHSNDLLSYLQQHINGCTNPQFYLKVRGVWTGGHQENINMCAININHGPSNSEWYTVPGEEVQRLRKALRQKFKQDLYQQEGLWFQKINWFIQNGFKITRIIQKPGDMVITGPGTLHWVRAYGVSLHSAWNTFPESHKMFISAFHRHHQNKKIRFRKSNIIPFKILTLKHLQHKMLALNQEEKYSLIIHLTRWLSQQQALMTSIKLHYTHIGLKIQQKKIQQHQSFCMQCLQQIMVYYIEYPFDFKIICLSCMMENDPWKEDLTVFYKTDPQQLFKFLSKSLTDQTYDNNFKYCSGEHIGKQCMKSKPQKSNNFSSLTTQYTQFGEQLKKMKTDTQINSIGMQTQEIQLSNKQRIDQNGKDSVKIQISHKQFHSNAKSQQKQPGEISDQSLVKKQQQNKKAKDKNSKIQSQRQSDQAYFRKKREDYSKDRSRSRDKKRTKHQKNEVNEDYGKKHKWSNHENRQSSTGKGQNFINFNQYCNKKYDDGKDGQKKEENGYKREVKNDKYQRKRDYIDRDNHEQNNTKNGHNNDQREIENNKKYSSYRDYTNQGYKQSNGNNHKHKNQNNYHSNQNSNNRNHEAKDYGNNHQAEKKNDRKRSQSEMSY